MVSVRQRTRTLAFVILMCTFASVSATDVQVVVVRDGRRVVVSDGPALAAILVTLAESCSVNSTTYAASEKAWAGIATSRSYVRVVFPEHRKISLVRSEDRLRSEQFVQEIRMPLPHGSWPAHVLVGTGHGIIALTKYDPIVLRKLAMLPELELATVAPYDSLMHLKEQQ